MTPGRATPAQPDTGATRSRSSAAALLGDRARPYADGNRGVVARSSPRRGSGPRHRRVGRTPPLRQFGDPGRAGRLSAPGLDRGPTRAIPSNRRRGATEDVPGLTSPAARTGYKSAGRAYVRLRARTTPRRSLWTASPKHQGLPDRQGVRPGRPGNATPLDGGRERGGGPPIVPRRARERATPSSLPGTARRLRIVTGRAALSRRTRGERG